MHCAREEGQTLSQQTHRAVTSSIIYSRAHTKLKHPTSSPVQAQRRSVQPWRVGIRNTPNRAQAHQHQVLLPLMQSAPLPHGIKLSRYKSNDVAAPQILENFTSLLFSPSPLPVRMASRCHCCTLP